MQNKYFDMFDMGDFFQVFVISRSTEGLIDLNFRLEMYVPYHSYTRSKQNQLH